MKSVVCAVAFAAMAGCVSASADTLWDMATPYPSGNFQTRTVAQFAADVESSTHGSLRINVHPAGSMFKHPDIKDAVRQGKSRSARC